MFGRQAIRLIRKMWTNPMQLAREVYTLLVDDAAPLYHAGPITLQKPSGVDPYFTFQGHTNGDNLFNLTGRGGAAAGSIGLYNGILGTQDSINGLQSAVVGGVPVPVIHLRDEKAQNTDGGTFTNGAWRTRDLTVETLDSHNHCTLLSNQFTLAAGTYEIQARAPARKVAQHQTRLQNITDDITTLTGSTADAGTADTTTTDSLLWGRFTITGVRTFELQHRCVTTAATTGLGSSANLTTEVYAEVWLRKTN